MARTLETWVIRAILLKSEIYRGGTLQQNVEAVVLHLCIALLISMRYGRARASRAFKRYTSEPWGAKFLSMYWMWFLYAARSLVTCSFALWLGRSTEHVVWPATNGSMKLYVTQNDSDDNYYKLKIQLDYFYFTTQ